LTARLRRAAACAAGLVVVSALVQSGATRGIDRFSLDWLRPLSGNTWILLALPAGAIPAVVIVFVLAVVVWRRDGWRAAWPWPAVVTVSLVAEVAGKQWISQIRFADPERIASVLSLHGSFPSGHVCRALLLATTVVWLWPRLRPVAGAFVAYMVVVVLVTGMHVLTDVAGGLLLGGGLALVAWELAERGRPAPPPGSAEGDQVGRGVRSMSSA
jgi:undecaprenyl-diphosphatase